MEAGDRGVRHGAGTKTKIETKANRAVCKAQESSSLALSMWTVRILGSCLNSCTSWVAVALRRLAPSAGLSFLSAKCGTGIAPDQWYSTGEVFIRQYLETFLAIITGEVLLVSMGQSPEMLLSTLPRTRHAPPPHYGASGPKCQWWWCRDTCPGWPPIALPNLTSIQFCEFGPEPSSRPVKISHSLMTDHYSHGSLCYTEEKINKQQAQRQGTLSSPAWEALQTEGLSPQGLSPSLAPMKE